MKKVCSIGVVFVLVGLGFVLVNGCGQKKTVAVESGKFSSAETTSFNEVTSKLDPGGSFYLYLGTEQWLKGLSDKVGSWRVMANAIPDLQDQHQEIENAFNVGTRLIKDSGLEDISGIGMSSIAREPGFYYNKMVVHHYPGKGNGFLWTMFGRE